MSLQRLVLDTNVLVSAFLFSGSIPAQAFFKARKHILLASSATAQELMDVLARDRFDRYLSKEIRRELAVQFLRRCLLVVTPTPIHACRDPKDDKFLEVAVHGHADCILTGDEDLLALHPFQKVAILTPSAWLQNDL
jgi:putative PIN family toxin of toxin-antitoxin system